MTWLTQEGFQFGELDQRSLGLRSSQQIERGAREFRDCVAGPLGQGRRRAGFRWLGETLDNKPASLIPFQVRSVDITADFMCEFTAGHLRVWDVATGALHIPLVDLPTPYGEGDLELLRFAQSPDTLWVVHPDYEPRTLNSSLTEFVPFDNNDTGPRYGTFLRAITIERTDTDVTTEIGANNTYEYAASEDLFLQTDEGSFWQINGGWIQMLKFKGPKTCWFEESEFPPEGGGNTSNTVVGPTLEWDGPWIPGENTGVTISHPAWGNPAGDNDLTTFTFVSPIFQTSDVGSLLDFNAVSPGENIGLIVSVVPGVSAEVVHIEGTLGANLGVDSVFYRLDSRDTPSRSTLYPSAREGTITITSTEPVFDNDMTSGTERPPLFFMNEGVMRLTDVTSSTTATATVIRKLRRAVPTNRWTQSYGPYTGFPVAIGFHQDRLVPVGVEKYPNEVPTSKTSIYDNMTPGPLDGDGIHQRLTDGNADRVVWVASNTDLIFGTEDGEFRGQGQPFTQSNLGFDLQSTFGSSNVQPVRADGSILFVDRCGTVLYEQTFRFDRDRYTAIDLTELSRHLFEGRKIMQLGYFRGCDQIVFARMSDGDLLSFTYRRETGVAAWSPWTGERIVSIARAPAVDKEQLWVCVERSVNGETKHYVEVWESDAVPLDSQITIQTTSRVVTGLDHLEGRNVMVRVDSDDGLLGPEKVVNGEVELAMSPDSQVAVGLAVEHRLEPNVIDSGDQQGSVSGRERSMRAVRILVHETTNVEVEVPGRENRYLVGDDYDIETSAVKAFSGWRSLDALDVATEDPTVVFTGKKAVHFELLAVSMKVEAGES